MNNIKQDNVWKKLNKQGIYITTDMNIIEKRVNKTMRTPYFKIAKKYAHSQNVLEAGCGEARVSFGLARTGCHVQGIDISPELITHLEKVRTHLPEEQHLLFTRADLRKFVQPERYHLILNHGVFEHFLNEKERQAILHNWHTSIMPFGYILIAVPNLHNKLFQKALKEEGVPEMVAFTHQQLQEEVCLAGFSVVEHGYLFVSEGYDLWLKHKWLVPLIQLTEKAWPFFPRSIKRLLSAHLYVVAQKKNHQDPTIIWNPLSAQQKKRHT